MTKKPTSERFVFQFHNGHLTFKLKYRWFTSHLLYTLLLFLFHLLPSPVHLTGFSFCFLILLWLPCHFYFIVIEQLQQLAWRRSVTRQRQSAKKKWCPLTHSTTELVVMLVTLHFSSCVSMRIVSYNYQNTRENVCIILLELQIQVQSATGLFLGEHFSSRLCVNGFFSGCLP